MKSATTDWRTRIIAAALTAVMLAIVAWIATGAKLDFMMRGLGYVACSGQAAGGKGCERFEPRHEPITPSQ